MRTGRIKLAFVALVAMCVSLFVALPAEAASGTFKLQSPSSEVSGGSWHIYAKIELPKAPLTAHTSMRFLFTKTMVYERSLIDGHADPVLNRQALQNQSPTVESLDVDFADPSGKVWKGTKFDFGLSRIRGYEAGEYTVELRTSDDIVIGTKQTLVLNGDNPPVDRRSMAFNAKDSKVKKVDNGLDGGSNIAQNDDAPTTNNNVGNGEVTPMGTATGFVPPEGMQETDEEKIKTKPGGCGCEAVGQRSPATGLVFLLPILGIGIAAYRRRRRVA